MEKLKNFETLSCEQVVDRLGTNPKTGLSEKQACRKTERPVV